MAAPEYLTLRAKPTVDVRALLCPKRAHRSRGDSLPQFPNKFPPALMRDRFCGVRRLRLSQVRVAGHLRTFVVAHGESRWNRILPERVAPPSRAHGTSPPFQGTALDIALRVGNARFSLIRPVHAPAPAASGERRGSSPAPRLRRPVE